MTQFSTCHFELVYLWYRDVKYLSPVKKGLELGGEGGVVGSTKQLTCLLLEQSHIKQLILNINIQ